MKFRLKMMFGTLCLVALLFGIGASSLIALSFESSLNREEESARESYRLLLDTVSMVAALGGMDASGDVSTVLDQLSDRGGSSWSALRFSSENDILYESGSASVGFEGDRSAVDADTSAVYSLSNGSGGWYFQLSGVCVIGEEPYYLDALYDISPLYEARSQQQVVFRVVFAALIVLCAALAYGMARLLTRPLSELARATREIASGNLGFRSSVKSDDEIGGLSADFDSMAEQVERSVLDMKRSLDRQERFMGSFAHEIKTPMTAIIGYADLMRREALDPTEQAEAARYIFSEGKRLENLSLKLLDLFVLDKQDICLSPASPAQLVREVTASYAANCGEGIAVEARCGEGTCFMEADLVRSLLLNLIDNACKAVGERGTIVVTCAMLPDGCRFVVEDDGGGIPPDALEHLSEAFYRVDPSRSRSLGGAGLGLSLCAKIAELHHGSLRVESELGEGTRVVAELRGGRP